MLGNGELEYDTIHALVRQGYGLLIGLRLGPVHVRDRHCRSGASGSDNADRSI